MKWRKYWRELLIVPLILALDKPRRSWNIAASPVHALGWTAQRKIETREKVRDLWYHGFDHYMSFAFPLDELTPISCSGKGPDWGHPENIATNDVAGNFSLTLIDVLDTLVVLGDRQGFENAVRHTIDWVSFDVNTKPQVFEVTIRVLGGLLSGHIYASRPGQPFYLPWYRGELLAMAHDLGTRLLPAFSTATGIPYARVHLRHGVAPMETPETCTAGAGSLILEFATLSRLTGDERFEKAAKKAFFAIWNRKSDIGLVGNTINIWTGLWTHHEVTGIGAGIDSFYEYALKWYVLSGEIEFLDVWQEAYASIMRYARSPDGFWYQNVNIHSGEGAYYTIDSLSAFWPGLQVLSGDVQNAIKGHMVFWNIWRNHSGLPEVWDMNFKQATSWQYPLRPELAESTWYLYRATRDPFYLDVGERILSDIISIAKVDCGLCSIKDLRTGEKDDRMESFALSETLKYLFLLFDEGNSLHTDDSNFVFTTEGHILSLDAKYLKPMSPARQKMRQSESHQCPAYYPVLAASDKWDGRTGLIQGVRSRRDFDYARHLVTFSNDPIEEYLWQPHGWCDVPLADLFLYDFILSPNGRLVAEEPSPGAHRLTPVHDGFVLHNVTGIRAHIVRRLDGRGYDITKLGPHSVHTGQIVYVNDSELFRPPSEGKHAQDRSIALREHQVQLHLFLDSADPMLEVPSSLLESPAEAFITAYTAHFGADLSVNAPWREKALRYGSAGGTTLVRDNSNLMGCSTYNHTHEDVILLIDRGECTFLQKLSAARAARAAGVLVISNDELPINPTAEAEELRAVGDLSDVALTLLTRTTGNLVLQMVENAEANGMGPLRLAVDLEGRSLTDEGEFGGATEKSPPETNHVLYINGHPLLNTRLLV